LFEGQMILLLKQGHDKSHGLGKVH
jgi:hypothetical protein